MPTACCGLKMLLNLANKLTKKFAILLTNMSVVASLKRRGN